MKTAAWLLTLAAPAWLATAEPGLAQSAAAASPIGSQNRDLPGAKLEPNGLAVFATSTGVPNSRATAPSGPYPAQFAVRRSSLGSIVVDDRGHSVYALIKVFAQKRYRGPAAAYCTGPCAAKWRAVAAPAGAEPIGAWTVVEGAQGRQWAFNGNPVFTFHDDTTPGDLKGHEFDDLWMAVNYVPPPPALALPPGVKIRFRDDAYFLADQDDRPLIALTRGQPVAEVVPFAAALLSSDIGRWTIDRSADQPQWRYKGRPVFVARSTELSDIPKQGAVLRP